MSNISQVKARQVLDSRGNPTVEVEVLLSDGARGLASVPSGASTGATEAQELRDDDPARFLGRGVLKAVEHVRSEIASALKGHSALHQAEVDSLLITLDGTSDKSRLGANALLGTSLAVARAGARSAGKPLYAFLRQDAPPVLPVPMLNIVNGGRHAENSTDFQEFMVVPAGFYTFGEALRAGVEVYHSLKALLRARGMNTAVGDEGGFAPSLSSNHEAVELVISAIERAGYVPGTQCFIALDVAASELLVKEGDGYSLSTEKTVLSAKALIDRYDAWIDQYPIISIEDGMAEEDWDSWQAMTDRLGERVQIVGDDLYTTNTARIKEGVELEASNAVLVKPNQIGTLTETLEAVAMTRQAGWGTVISHRSGDTEDSFIADLAVGTSAGQIKSGAPTRGERTAKYNRLLRIEEELGEDSTFAGLSIYSRFVARL